MHPKTNRTKVCVFVSNLPNEASEADIRAFFSQYAEVHDVRLSSGGANCRSQGFGYIDLSADQAEKVVSAVDGHMFIGSVLRVSVASRPEQSPHVSRNNLPAGETQRPDDERPSSVLRHRYEVTSVKKATIPAQGQGNDWYCYVLSSGKARITGFHRGTLDEVTAYASGCAEDYNQRAATGKSTRALASMAYSKKK